MKKSKLATQLNQPNELPTAADANAVLKLIFPASLPQRIVLTGFMAAGKSTVGRILADRLNRQFVDIDTEIESDEGLSVSEIFRKHGEPHFREFEHQKIRKLFSTSSNPLVLALGGGALEDERTRILLLSDTSGQNHLIFLSAALETVLIRAGKDGNSRPLLADRNSLQARFDRRLPLYRQAHQTVIVDQLHPAEVVDAILEALQTTNNL